MGADIVELNPAQDVSGLTAMVCGRLVKEIAARMLEGYGWPCHTAGRRGLKTFTSTSPARKPPMCAP